MARKITANISEDLLRRIDRVRGRSSHAAVTRDALRLWLDVRTSNGASLFAWFSQEFWADQLRKRGWVCVKPLPQGPLEQPEEVESELEEEAS